MRCKQPQNVNYFLRKKNTKSATHIFHHIRRFQRRIPY